MTSIVYPDLNSSPTCHIVNIFLCLIIHNVINIFTSKETLILILYFPILGPFWIFKIRTP